MTTSSRPVISWRFRAMLAALLAGVLLFLVLLLNSRAEPAIVILAAEKTDSLIIDANGDGLPNAGDTLFYEISITNSGDEPATAAQFADNPDGNTTLVAGSVLASQGTVSLGNTPGDTSVYVTLGSIPASGAVTISFHAQINEPLLPSVTEISNQGILRCVQVPVLLTDDPDTPAAGDPTITTLVHPTIIVEKTLVAADLDEVTPNFVTFTISIENTGSTAVDVLPLFDEYDTAYLSFAGATTSPNEGADDGLLTWYDLTGPVPNGFGGNLPPGGTFVLTTVFSVTSDITVTANTARVTGALDASGLPLGAEDDDAVVVNVPTAAELLYFRIGEVTGREVRLEWATAVEIDNVGFKLYRAFDSVCAEAEQVAYIPSQAEGGGAVYTHVDSVPQYGDWWYWLVDVDTSGQETFQGAVGTTVERHLPVIYLPLALHETLLP
ncbi:MAG: hypothetical protein ACK2US_19230 [Anaerolineae bacterium]